MPTINDLRQQAATIKNATQVGENTATRVGTTFETIADLLEGASVGQGVPSVDLSQLNALRTPTDQTTANPTIYNVTTLHNLSSTTIKVGTLFIFSDGGRAVVTQILLSNYQVDGGGNISSPNTSQITMYYRMFNIVQETWSAWTLYAGGGGGGTIDPYPVSGSDNAVASNGVFEGLQKAAPEVNINDINDLDDFVDMQTGVASTYTIKAYHNLSSTWLRVGVLMVFANQAQNTLTQICISNCMVDGGGNLIPNYATNVMNVFYRFKQFSGNPPEGMTIGVWTTWAKFGDSGYQPDNEDIDLNANDQLQFANKAYDASAFSGLGRVYLRKNIVQLNLTDKYFDGFVNDVLVQDVGTSSTPDAILFDTTRKMFVARVGLLYYVDWSSDEDYNPITRDVNWNYNGNFYRWNGEELVQWDKTINQLTQAMMNTANAIYHIQYDYDLNGQTITLPAGCVLEFDGGSLAHGTITGNGNVIHGNGHIFGNELVVNISNYKSDCSPRWFGNETSAINKAINAFPSSAIFIDGEWSFDETIVVPFDTTINSHGGIITANDDAPVMVLYCGKNGVNLSALQINHTGEYDGVIVEVYGASSSHSSIRGYASVLERNFAGNDVLLPIVSGTRNQIAVRLHDDDLFYMKTFKSYAYNVSTHLRCERNGNSSGLNSCDLYIYSWFPKIGLSLSKGHGNSTRFFMHYQCYASSEKVIAIDNYVAGSTEDNAVYYITLWDTSTSPNVKIENGKTAKIFDMLSVDYTLSKHFAYKGMPRVTYTKTNFTSTEPHHNLGVLMEQSVYHLNNIILAGASSRADAINKVIQYIRQLNTPYDFEINLKLGYFYYIDSSIANRLSLLLYESDASNKLTLSNKVFFRMVFSVGSAATTYYRFLTEVIDYDTNVKLVKNSTCVFTNDVVTSVTDHIYYKVPVDGRGMTTAQLPSILGEEGAGYSVFNKTLGKMVVWNGTGWVDATGTAV